MTQIINKLKNKMSNFTVGQLREQLKDSPDDVEISVGATIEYTKQKSPLDTAFNSIMATLVVVVMVLLLILLGMTIGYQSEKVKIVRDTIYVKTKYEVSVKGPHGYTEYFNEDHSLDLQTSDGEYHFKQYQVTN